LDVRIKYSSALMQVVLMENVIDRDKKGGWDKMCQIMNKEPIILE
jgi:hypothetical protein